MDLFKDRGASPMLIGTQQEPFDDVDWLYELKLDGFRCLSYADQNMADFRNKRNMKMLPKFPELKGVFRNVDERCILDGEVVVMQNGVPDFYRLQKRTLLTDPFKIELEASRHPASFVAFDCLYQGDEEMIWTPLSERKQRLASLINENERISVSRFIERNGIALYQAADERELEGVVAKRKNSIYSMGARSKDWIKFKRMSDEDFIVAGYLRKGRHIYSLVLAKYRQGAFIYKGHVTSGVTKETISSLNTSGINPFSVLPMGNEEAVWVKLNHVCIVEYMPNTRNSLRQPVFKGYREDVLPEDIQG